MIPVSAAAFAGGKVAMRSLITPACVCSFLLIVGCAKTEDAPQAAKSAPSTQPAAVANPPDMSASEMTPAEPTASVMRIGAVAQWFPPARLRLTSSDGKVVARLYSDDPRGVLTGKDTVNSYDMKMVLPDISDPADVSGRVWAMGSQSMEMQDAKYGIFLNSQHDILQPMNVTVSFQGGAPRMNVIIRGTFSLFHISDQTPNPAPTMVSVDAFLDAKVMEN
jgi:hypothetical protein